jgi:serine/threonine protein kinase
MGVSGETRASLSGVGGGDETYCATCSRSFDMAATHCPHDGTKLVRFKATEDALLGKVLDGRFQIQKPLGEGGMGTVYRGVQLSVDREVAIKVVHPSIAAEREAAKRFLREARLSSRLNAPNIVNVYDFGQSEDGVLYLVMELVKGQTLHQLLRANGMLHPTRAANIALQMCDALEAAHQVGIVHRDLKPGNVIVLDDPPGRDHIKVLDFGLAKSVGQDSMSGITNTHAMLGTPVYMAPEQIEGAAVDGRTDLYSLGCMLHELLTGSPPFTDNVISALFAKHLHDEPPPLPDHVPPALAAIVMRLLEKAPAARFASAAMLREALARAIAQTPASGVPVNRSSSPIVHGLSGPMSAQPASIGFAPTSAHPTPPGSIGFAPTSAHPTPPGSIGYAPTSAQTSPPRTMAPIGIDGAPPKSRRIAVIAGSAMLATALGILIVMATRKDESTSSSNDNNASSNGGDTKPSGSVDTKPSGSVDTKPTGSVDTKPTGSVDTKPTGNVDTKPTGDVDTKPTASSGDAKPANTSVDAKASDTPTSAAADTKTADTKTADTKTQPTGTKPTGTRPMGTKPDTTGTRPTGTKPTGTKPTGATDTKPTKTKPTKDPEELPFLTPK